MAQLVSDWLFSVATLQPISAAFTLTCFRDAAAVPWQQWKIRFDGNAAEPPTRAVAKIRQPSALFPSDLAVGWT